MAHRLKSQTLEDQAAYICSPVFIRSQTVPALLQAVYTLLGGETLTLTEMIVIMAVVCMVMAQIPTMHALWFINLLNLVSVFIFTYMTVAVAIWQTCYYKLPRDYGVHGSPVDKAFGVFQGIVIMHFAYG